MNRRLKEAKCAGQTTIGRIRACLPASALVAALTAWSPPVARAVQVDPQPENGSISGASEETPAFLLEKIEAVAQRSRSARSATEYSAVIERCEQILAAGPLSPEHAVYLKSLMAWGLNRRAATRMELAERFEKIGNVEQASQILKSAQDDLDASIRLDDDRWLARKNRALLFSQLNDLNAAIADWTRVIELQPDGDEHFKALFNRAELLYAIDEPDKSLADYRGVLERNANDLQALNGAGNCLLAMGKPNEAIEQYNAILETDPENAGALANRGEAREQLVQWNLAVADYRAAIAGRSSPRTQRRLAWLLATCPDDSVLDGRAAIDLIKGAIAAEGETAENLDTLAAALAADGQFARARDVQTRVIDLAEPDDEGFRVRQAMYENEERFVQPAEQGDGGLID